MHRLSAKDRRQQLLDVSMRLFSVQGFDGTTTREIADAAGVNEAIIFRHFASKEELYWAVVNARRGVAGRKRKIEQCLRANTGDREVLASIAATLLERNEEDMALTRLLLFTALRNPKLSEDFFRNYIAETFDLLAEFFRKGIKDGRIRRVDPVVAARGFLGMVSHHYLVQELFGGNRYQQFDLVVLGRQLADIWMNGISADPAIATSRRSVHNTVDAALLSAHEGG
jgi:TetR/AcrR family transcriptional regulator